MSLRLRWWPWLLLLLLPLAIGLGRLRFDVEVLNLLPEELPVVQGLKLYQEKFSNAKELIITLQSPEAGQTEEAARRLAVLLRTQTNLVEAAHWQPPWNEHPRDFAELMAALWFNQPPEKFSQLAARFDPSILNNALQQAREQMALSLSPSALGQRGYDPLDLLTLPEGNQSDTAIPGSGPELFSSPDGRFRLVFVEARPDLTGYRECTAWLESIGEVIEQARKTGALPASVRIQFTGRPAFVSEISSGMEEDMFGSAGGTLLIIAALFWWAHRRWRPLLWLLVLLGVVLLVTLALGGLIYGTLNVVSLGFAAILLGLGVDYALVLYQESQAAPEVPLRTLRREVSRGIFWSAITSAGAFLVLNWGGLPGLAQLGTLVAIGIGVAALVMVGLLLPPLHGKSGQPAKEPAPGINAEINSSRSTLAWLVTALVLLVSAMVLMRGGLPTLDRTTASLRPKNSPSYAAIESINTQLDRGRDPLWLIVRGENASEVAQRLDAAQRKLERGLSNGIVREFTLPTSLWPRPENQKANREVAQALGAQIDSFRAAARAQGFTPEALVLTEQMLSTWKTAGANPGVFWPENQTSRWVFDRVTSRRGTEFLALGFVSPADDIIKVEDLISTPADQTDPAILAGWELLGTTTFKKVQTSMWQILIPMALVVMTSLWFAFRRTSEVLLTVAMLLFNLVCLLTIMRLAGWSWNLLNLMAVPLLLGVADDYSIHMQLALRRHRGDLRQTRRIIGRALLLCGGTTITGFGSLAFSSNAGLASLGQICAAGIACCVFSGVFLLPYWWQRFSAPSENSEPVHSPSTLYRRHWWQLSLRLVQWLPLRISAVLARMLARLYWHVKRDRRQVIIENLLPVTGGDRVAAKQRGGELLENFAQKLVDLWRYEGGSDVTQSFTELTGWEDFVAAESQGRGVLLLTPHLGNWEFGGPLLTGRGYKLQVITLREPGQGLTEMRLASRARRGIETLVIGEDPFAFVEIIKRLQAGAIVALLMDRPPAASAVSVELFGRPFAASIAAAELARASGCVLLPVCLPRTDQGYAAHILPEVHYDRRALGDRAARKELTQEIMRVFEPSIRKYLNQWYHFIPIWPPS